ncbi:MAG: hypothetical protein HFJ54_04015 [Clostridia bacterium]|nr:hypothetical protein [Clostridia bacterium]
MECYFGDISDIEDEIVENFKTSNIYHILAVSGTHVRNYYYRINYIPR